MSDRSESEDAASDRMRPSRLLAYYGLLFLFIFLTSQLLKEVGTRFHVEECQQIEHLIHEAFNPYITFDDVTYTLFSLLMAFIFSLPVAWVYTLTKDEEGFDPALVHTVVVLSMVVTGVMIVIGNELARAFSLAGVVAAVRFRSTLDDARDAVYLFIAIAIGMACGTRVYHIAIWMSLVMSVTLYLLWKYRFGRQLHAGTASLVDLLSAGGKKKKANWLTGASPELRRRIEGTLEQQARLVHWASLQGGKKKKPDTAIVVESRNLGHAQAHVESVLAEQGGRWQLANLAQNGDGQGLLEYIGRLPKRATPATMLTALRQDSTGLLDSVEVRSLKGLKLPWQPAAAGEPLVPPSSKE
jgi:hypothetical protein